MEVVTYMLNHLEIDVDQLTGDGMTALHCAARKGNLLLVRRLIEGYGANYLIRDDVISLSFLYLFDPHVLM
jgi:ankyrin repeat protein